MLREKKSRSWAVFSVIVIRKITFHLIIGPIRIYRGLCNPSTYGLFSTMMRVRWRTQSWLTSSWSTTVIRPTMFSTCSTSHPTKELSQCSIAFTDALAFRHGSGPDRIRDLRKIKIRLFNLLFKETFWSSKRGGGQRSDRSSPFSTNWTPRGHSTVIKIQIWETPRWPFE